MVYQAFSKAEDQLSLYPAGVSRPVINQSIGEGIRLEALKPRLVAEVMIQEAPKGTRLLNHYHREAA